jgi:tetrahydromethanopterin S-methyltransferase subunit F
MYVGVGALDEAGRSRFMQLVPKCYTKEFDDCWHERDMETYPNCPAIQQLWAEDKDWANKTVDDMPYCSSAKARDEKIVWAVGAGIVGLVIGILVAGVR